MNMFKSKTRSEKIRYITGLGILLATVVVLAFISNYVVINGTININLALIPIIIGACIYGPTVGLMLGIVDGAIILTAPSTAGFLAYNPVATVFLCLLKTGIAGLLVGFLFKWLSKTKLNMILTTGLSSVIVPIVNTSLFFAGVSLWFVPLFGESAAEALKILFTTTFLCNFLIEFTFTVIMVPVISKLIQIVIKQINSRKKTLEDVNDEENVEETDD